MSKLIDLTQKEFIGQTVPKDVDEFYDYKRQGSYKIHIPELMPHLEKDEGIWCKNHTNKWNITPSDLGEYGSHYPLQPGTYVIVKFFENDINAGYVDRIVSDYKEERDVECQDCVDPIPAIEDRDEQYLIFKTPKKWSAFYVNEDTLNEPNTMYLVYNRDNNPSRRTVYRIDETGIHVWSRNNIRIRILEDENYQTDGNKTHYLKGNEKYNTDGNRDYHLKGKSTSKFDSTYDHTLEGNHTSKFNSNYDHTLKGNSTSIFESNYDHTLKGNSTSKIEGNKDAKVNGTVTVEIEGNCNISVNGTVNLWSGSNINIDASPNINLNCGIASKTPSNVPNTPNVPEEPLPKTEVKDLGPGETPEYKTGVGKGCDSATNNYNVEKRDNEKMIP